MPTARSTAAFGILACLLLCPAFVRADAPVYNESADAKKDIAAAVARAGREDKRVLLDFGGNWCGWCTKLHGVFTTNDDVRTVLRNEYEVVYVDIGHGDKNQDVLGTYGVKLQGVPYLAVLDGDNKLVTQQETGALEDGPAHDPKKVTAFLDRWKAQPRDAQQALDAALSQASREDKQVFLRFGAPWCGWCHKLDDVVYQEGVWSALSADFVVLKVDVDRMPHGKDVQTRYQTAGGIPWFAVLSSDGTAVSKSELAPGQNIGFPTERAEVDHVVKMLTGRHAHMTDAQADAVREAFTKGAAAAKERLSH